MITQQKSVTASNISKKFKNGETVSLNDKKTISYTQYDKEDSFSKKEYKVYNEVYVWGQNNFGQLGLQQIQSNLNSLENDLASQKSNSHIFNIPKACCFNIIVKKASCGMSHTILLSQTGHLYSMGSNQYGQLGINFESIDVSSENDQQTIRSQPCLIEELDDYFIEDVVSGNDHVLAVSADGLDLFSWGQGKFGALGIQAKSNQIKPQKIYLKDNQQVSQIAAGSRHSAFILKNDQSLYMFGLGSNGQLGLGKNQDKVYQPQKVDLNGERVIKAGLGDTHSIIITENGHLMSTGANDKYQLGQNMQKRSLNLFNFQRIQQFKLSDKNTQASYQEIVFKDISCWNLNAAIDSEDGVYIWGILHDKQVKQSLCIKIPEKVNLFKARQVAIGPTMAFMVDKKKGMSFVIGVNQNGELGLGDKNQRKTFCIQESLKDQKIQNVAIGKSGFVIAISENIKHVEDVISDSQSNIDDGQSVEQSINIDQKEITIIQQDKNLFSFQDQRQFENAQILETQKQIIEIKNQILELKQSNDFNKQIEQLEGKLYVKEQIISENCQLQLLLQQKIKELEKKIDSQNQKMDDYQKNSIEIQCNRSEMLKYSQKSKAQQSQKQEIQLDCINHECNDQLSNFKIGDKMSLDQTKSRQSIIPINYECEQITISDKNLDQKSIQASNKTYQSQLSKQTSFVPINNYEKQSDNQISYQKIRDDQSNEKLSYKQTERPEQISYKKSSNSRNHDSYQSNYLRNKNQEIQYKEQSSCIDIKEGQHYATLRSKQRSLQVHSKNECSSYDHSNYTQQQILKQPESQFFDDKLRQIECLNEWVDQTQFTHKNLDSHVINQELQTILSSAEKQQLSSNKTERNEENEEAKQIIEKIKNNKYKSNQKQIEKLEMIFFIQEKIIEDFNKRLYERVDQVEEKDKQIQKLNDELKNLQDKFELENAIRQSIQVENGNNQIMIQDLKIKNQNLLIQNDELTNDIINSKQTIQELQSDNYNLKQENQQKDQNIQNKDIQVQELIDENRQINEEIEDLKNEKIQLQNEYQQKCEDYQNQILTMKEEKVQIKEEIIKSNQKIENEFKNQINKKKKQIQKLSQQIKTKQEQHKAELDSQLQVVQKLELEIEESKKQDLKNQRSASPKPYYESLIAPNGTLENSQNQAKANKNKNHNALPLRPLINDNESVKNIVIKVDDSQKASTAQFQKTNEKQEFKNDTQNIYKQIQKPRNQSNEITVLEMINQNTKNKDSLLQVPISTDQIQNFLNQNINNIQKSEFDIQNQNNNNLLNNNKISESIVSSNTQFAASQNNQINQQLQSQFSPQFYNLQQNNQKKNESILQKMLQKPQEQIIDFHQKKDFKILRSSSKNAQDQTNFSLTKLKYQWDDNQSQIQKQVPHIFDIQKDKQAQNNFYGNQNINNIANNLFSTQIFEQNNTITSHENNQKQIQFNHNFISNFGKTQSNAYSKGNNSSIERQIDLKNIQTLQTQQDKEEPQYQDYRNYQLNTEMQYDYSSPLNDSIQIQNEYCKKQIFSNSFSAIYDKQRELLNKRQNIYNEKYSQIEINEKYEDQENDKYIRENLMAYSISSNSGTSHLYQNSSPNFTHKQYQGNIINSEGSKFVLQKIQGSEVSVKNII